MIGLFDGYRRCGGIDPIGAANAACSSRFTGLWRTRVLAGSLPRKLSFLQLRDGRIGRGTNPPPQFGHTLPSTVSTHGAQNVHSYEQIRASSACGGRGLLQFSHVGRNSSVVMC